MGRKTALYGLLILASLVVVLVAPVQPAEGSSEPEAAITCDDHCDCPQGEICHRGECRGDLDQPVYKCDQPGCQPGGWCVECDGTRSVCGSDPDWHCDNACNCGPGWCCQDGTCHADTGDPDSPCVRGVDATHCSAHPSCWQGQLNWLDAGLADDFRCFNPDTAEVADTCLTGSCFFDCEVGLSCLDLRADDPRLSDPGVVTSLLGGGCVSQALAEAVFGWRPADLVDRCSAFSLEGEECVAGWRPGNTDLIVRILGAGQSCGNGACEFALGETSANCPDCSCGDGYCDTSEVGTCSADCGSCDASGCEAPVMPLEWASLSACGDGVCQCDGTVPENAQNCPDCVDAPDADSDGVPDRCDGCPVDATKTEPGVCGCGQPELDTDADGVLDCIDNCSDAPNPDQADFDADGIGDSCDPDIDADGVGNDLDVCPDTVLPDTPTRRLGWLRFAAQHDGTFDAGLRFLDGRYTLADTGGCSGAQIIDELGLGPANVKYGISWGWLEYWIRTLP